MKKIYFAVAMMALLCAGNVVYAQTPTKKAEVKEVKKEQTVSKKEKAPKADTAKYDK